MIEIYDCTNHMSPPVLSKFFATEVMKYGSNNRESPPVTKGQISTYGKSSSSFRGSINWNSLSESIISAQSTESFKTGRETNVIVLYVDKVCN